MRVLCHAQHLSGVGHYVRMLAIARGLAGAHEVHFILGGRAVPPSPADAALRVISLPPLARTSGALVALDGAADAAAVIAARARALADAVERIRPDAVLIDHYPFSKWELESELVAAIDAARATTPRARIICSLRDIAPQTRHERLERGAYEARVLRMLEERFDALLVHGDPSFTRFEDHFGRAAGVPVPIHYTGFVVDGGSSAAPADRPDAYAVLSCGGGAWNTGFLLDAMDAFRRLSDTGALGSMPLLVFGAAFSAPADLAALERAAADGPFQIRRFTPDFSAYLHHSTLSISRAGYNTCAAILHAGVRAVLAPDPSMSDQTFRARRLAQLGLATRVDGSDVAALVTALHRAMQSPPPHHRLSLDGVARTRALVEDLVRQ